jgi:hypothetical protein
MECAARKQLDVIITRAGSMPLHLEVFWPVRSGTLELIASRQTPIERLELFDTSMPRFTARRFQGFNFISLRRLHINDVCNGAAKLMDIALNSTQEDFHLHLTIDNVTVHLFNHQLIQRITQLELFSGVSILPHLVKISNCIYQIDEPYRVSFNGPSMPLPKAKKCIFHPDFAFMGIFDLTNIKCLELAGYLNSRDLQTYVPLRQHIVTTLPPAQLVELELSSAILNYSISTDLPYCLPNLTKLQMRRVGLHAPLLRYFRFPRLKVLLLDFVLCMPPTLLLPASVPPPLDDFFFRSIPELEDLSIYDMTTMDGALFTSLHFCSSLHKLHIALAVLKMFIPAFGQQVKEAMFLPKLEDVSIRRSWPSNLDIDPTVFIRQVQVDRPGLKIWVNDNDDSSSVESNSSSESSSPSI